jgi:hypothetical protein
MLHSNKSGTHILFHLARNTVADIQKANRTVLQITDQAASEDQNLSWYLQEHSDDPDLDRSVRIFDARPSKKCVSKLGESFEQILRFLQLKLFERRELSIGSITHLFPENPAEKAGRHSYRVDHLH